MLHIYSGPIHVKNSVGQLLLSFILVYNTETFKLYFMFLTLASVFLYNKINNHITATLIKYLTLFHMEKKERRPSILLPLAEFSKNFLLHLGTWIIK